MRVRPVRRTARSTTTRPGIVAASRSTRGRRPPTARCGRSRPTTCRTRTAGDSTNLSRAFIQWGGFTFGRTVSFTDHEGSLGDSGMRSLHQTQNQSDTGANGTNQIAYTWQLGNGITLNVGADERRVKSIANLSTVTTFAGSGDAQLGAAVGLEPVPPRSGSNHPNPWVSLRDQPGLGPCQRRGDRQPQSRRLTTPPVGACACAQQTTPARRCRLRPSGRQVGLGGDLGHRDQARHAEPGQPDRWLLQLRRRCLGLRRRQQPGEPRPLWQRQHSRARLRHRLAVRQQRRRSRPRRGRRVAGSNTSGPATSRARSTATTPRSATTTPSPTAAGSAVACQHTSGGYQKAGGTCDSGFKFWTVGTHHDWFPLPGLRFAVDVMYTAIEFEHVRRDDHPGQPNVRRSRPTASTPIKDLGIVSAIFRAQRTWGAN